MTRRFVILNLGLAALLVLAYLGVVRWGESGSGSRWQGRSAGQDAPAFTLPVVAGLEGQAELSLAELRGRPLVLNFWASWCTACSAERPALEALRDAAAGGRGAVVGIATLDKIEEIKALEAASPHGYPLILDAAGKVAQAYDVQGLPQTFVVDAQGKIVRHFIGVLKNSDVEDVKRLLTVPKSH